MKGHRPLPLVYPTPTFPVPFPASSNLRPSTTVRLTPSAPPPPSPPSPPTDTPSTPSRTPSVFPPPPPIILFSSSPPIAGCRTLLTFRSFPLAAVTETVAVPPLPSGAPSSATLSLREPQFPPRARPQIPPSTRAVGRFSRSRPPTTRIFSGPSVRRGAPLLPPMRLLPDPQPLSPRTQPPRLRQ